jgi:hypothetical protein
MPINDDKLSGGKGFTPSQKADRAQPQPQTQDQTPPHALALPSQGRTILRQAIAQTQDQMAEVDQIVAQSKKAVLGYFDQRMKEAKGEMALELMERMGIVPDSPEAVDFFDETPLDIDGEFAKLLAPKAPALAPQSEPEAQRVLAEVV